MIGQTVSHYRVIKKNLAVVAWQAVDEYQSFLSHFEGSRTKLLQVAEARAALQRLMR